MTRERKLLYAGGIFILFLFHIVAAFALGVYVGRYGVTREGLTLQGPRNVGPAPAQPPDKAPQPVQPGADQPFGPSLPGEPTVIGRIRRIGRNTLDLATREGPRQVVLDEETKVRTQAGEIVALDGLAEGQIVAIFGLFRDDGQQLQANVVILLPSPEGEPDQP
jgi:hypothetical protein